MRTKAEIVPAPPEVDEAAVHLRTVPRRKYTLSTTFLTGLFGIVGAIAVFLLSATILIAYMDETHFGFNVKNITIGGDGPSE